MDGRSIILGYKRISDYSLTHEKYGIIYRHPDEITIWYIKQMLEGYIEFESFLSPHILMEIKDLADTIKRVVKLRKYEDYEEGKLSVKANLVYRDLYVF